MQQLVYLRMIYLLHVLQSAMFNTDTKSTAIHQTPRTAPHMHPGSEFTVEMREILSVSILPDQLYLPNLNTTLEGCSVLCKISTLISFMLTKFVLPKACLYRSY